MSNPKRKRNAELSLPKNKFVNAKVRMKDGKLQVMVDQSLLGHASASGSVSVNPKRSAIETLLYNKFRREGKSQQEAERLAKLNAPYYRRGMKNPSGLAAQVSAIGYELTRGAVDSRGKKHAFKTSPSRGSGPTNYFASAAGVRRYIKQVKQVRSWQ